MRHAHAGAAVAAKAAKAAGAPTPLPVWIPFAQLAEDQTMSWPSRLVWWTALPVRSRRLTAVPERSRIFWFEWPLHHQLGKTARSESHGKLQPRGHRPLAVEALAERTPWAATVQSLRGLWGRASRKQTVPDGMVRPRAAHSSRKCVSQDPKIAVRAVLRARSSLECWDARFLRPN